MTLRFTVVAATIAAFAAPAALAGTVSTPNIAGGLGTMLAPPSAPVIVGSVGSAPSAGSAPASGGPAPGGSAFVSGFVSAYSGGGNAPASTTQANE